MARRRASKKPKLTLPKSIEHHQQYVVLTCVKVVTKNSPLAELSIELAALVSELVEDLSRWTLETASAAGLAHLLPRLAKREWEGVGPAFRQLRFRFALTQMYRSVHLGVLQWWLSSYLQMGEEMSEPDCWEICRSAVEKGRLDTLEWLQSQNALPSMSGDIKRVYCAHPQVIYWLHEQDNAISFHVDLVKIATAGDFSLIKWAHAHRSWYAMLMSWNDVDFSVAIHGHSEIVQWMQANRPRDVTIGAWCGAVVGGHVEMVRWVACHRCFDDKLFLNMYDKYNKLVKRVPTPMVQWFLSEYKWDSPELRRNWIKKTLVLAARCGNLDAVQLLWSNEDCDYSISHGYGPTTHSPSSCAMAEAASKGHLHVVKWLQTFLKCDSDAAKAAARNGHLDIVEWLPSGGGDMEDVVYDAVDKGHLDIIKLLCKDRSFLISKNCVARALRNGNMAMVQYLYQLTGRSGRFSGSAAIAAQYGHLEILKWLHDESQLSGNIYDLTKIVENGYLDVLKYLNLHYELVFTTNHAALAARNGHFDLLEWLMKHYSSIANLQVF